MLVLTYSGCRGSNVPRQLTGFTLPKGQKIAYYYFIKKINVTFSIKGNNRDVSLNSTVTSCK